MWGLLHPKLLSGEGGYYLTMLASTIHGLKSDDAASAEDREVRSTNTVWGGGILIPNGLPLLESLGDVVHLVCGDDALDKLDLLCLQFPG